ncbi:hypothetical protein AAC691_05855 [Nguyenibacter vanlangensis]|uniref:Transposase n=1 Tax=Nguyenibacter vanlangensis TaxID=1216886 RepID=A0ABZ3D828_9PROT
MYDIRFPLAKGVTQKTVAARLDAIAGLRSESSTFWNWVTNAPAAPHRATRQRFRNPGRAGAGGDLDQFHG